MCDASPDHTRNDFQNVPLSTFRVTKLTYKCSNTNVQQVPTLIRPLYSLPYHHISVHIPFSTLELYAAH